MPSSHALARFLAQKTLAYTQENDYVLELGAGTGRFGQALLAQGLPPEKLICLELDPDLVLYLQKKFPHTNILQGNAMDIATLLPVDLKGKVGVVISGLPMLNFSPLVQNKILEGCFGVLKAQGCLIQFTYSLISPLKIERFGLEKKDLGWVLANIPPAHVWHYTKKYS